MEVSFEGIIRNGYNAFVMKRGALPVIQVGQKLLNKRRQTIYVVRNIEEDSVVLVSEDGSRSLRCPVDAVSLEEYERLYD